MKLINWLRVSEVLMPRLNQRGHRASLIRFCHHSHAASAPPLPRCVFLTFQGDGLGSNAVAMFTMGKSVAGDFFLEGEKTHISNGGIADIYVDIARTGETVMAKLYATEATQRVIEMAVQFLGGDGVRYGFVVESLYREIRAFRINEGASDLQRVVIARSVLA